MVLLAALVAYPALGPALFLHRYRTSRADPMQTWAQFCVSLALHRDPANDLWPNLADSKMTPVQTSRGPPYSRPCISSPSRPLPMIYTCTSGWGPGTNG